MNPRLFGRDNLLIFSGSIWVYKTNTNFCILASRAFRWANQIFTPANSTADIRQGMILNFRILPKLALQTSIRVFQKYFVVHERSAIKNSFSSQYIHHTYGVRWIHVFARHCSSPYLILMLFLSSTDNIVDNNRHLSYIFQEKPVYSIFSSWLIQNQTNYFKSSSLAAL